MDRDSRFSREIKNAKDKFGEENIEHGVEFFENSDRINGNGKIVFIQDNISSIAVLDYIRERDNLAISGGGKHNGKDVTAAKVL